VFAGFTIAFCLKSNQQMLALALGFLANFFDLIFFASPLFTIFEVIK
jgi:hypothetical protein